MSIKDMTNTARTYREIQAEIKELEAQADALKQQMIAEMDTRKVDALDAGEYTIRYSVYESGRFDSTKFKKDQPGVYAAYTKQNVATRFQVA